jgi:hypothetical protein
VSKRTGSGTAKNLQIRLGPQAHEQVKRLAARREKSIADTIREAIEVYAINLMYASQGKPLFWEDENGNKTKVLIPGFNVDPSAFLVPQSESEH